MHGWENLKLKLSRSKMFYQCERDNRTFVRKSLMICNRTPEKTDTFKKVLQICVRNGFPYFDC